MCKNAQHIVYALLLLEWRVQTLVHKPRYVRNICRFINFSNTQHWTRESGSCFLKVVGIAIWILPLGLLLKPWKLCSPGTQTVWVSILTPLVIISEALGKLYYLFCLKILICRVGIIVTTLSQSFVRIKWIKTWKTHRK